MKITEVPNVPGTVFRLPGDQHNMQVGAEGGIFAQDRPTMVSLTLRDLQRDDFEIIDPEPKVLNAKELVLFKIGDSINDDEFLYDELIDLAEISDQNGQLKQWLNHKELREEIQEMIDIVKSGLSINYKSRLNNLEVHLSNLKPSI